MVLQRLLEKILFINPEKCEFHFTEDSFLGFVVAHGRLQPDPAKIWVVEKWLAHPHVMFCEFLQEVHLRTQASPSSSNHLTLICSPRPNATFQRLKALFTNTPVGQHPDPACQLVLDVDASESGVRAKLSQHHSTTHIFHPCAFFSQHLSPDVGILELLAVVPAFQECRRWLEGN